MSVNQAVAISACHLNMSDKHLDGFMTRSVGARDVDPVRQKESECLVKIARWK